MKVALLATMSERYYSPTPITADRLELSDREAHHLLRVMRATVGTGVTVFDGSGIEFDAVVTAHDRRTVQLRVVQRRAVNRELPFSLTLSVALPKGDRQKWLVGKLTELGVTQLIPLVTHRGVAQPTQATVERLNRIVIESSKQCGRNQLMKIAAPQELEEYLRDTSPAASPVRRLIAHVTEDAVPKAAFDEPVATHVAVGPEGGFTDAEFASALAAGWTPVCLGSRILRVETAAIVMAARLVSA